MSAPRAPGASLADIESAWDRAVDATPDVDEFCTSSLWSFAAAESFPHVGAPQIVGDGVAFCGMRHGVIDDDVGALVGLDPVWGFATPCVGPAPHAARALEAVVRGSSDRVALIGGQDDASELCAAIVHRLEHDHRLLRGPSETRLRADLRDGADAWFARRSGRFRQQLRAIERRAVDTGIEVSDASAESPDAVMDRILAMESRSWKGGEGTGLANEDLAGFYRAMAWRLARRDALRVLFATEGGIDVGFILGGVRGSTYRGLQISYAASHADASIGHLLQYHQIRRSASEALALYDLGMDIEYKRRWADEERSTFTLIAVSDGG